MPDKYKDKYRIPSNRLRGWDYARNGHYYITIVTADRKRLFGEIVNDEMVLNDWGQIVYDEFFKSFEIRDELFLGEFVLMPDDAEKPSPAFFRIFAATCKTSVP